MVKTMTAGTNLLQPSLSTIPAELTSIDQWVVWRSEERKGKLTKIPYDAKTGQHASTTDATTWSTFDQAVAMYESGGYSGIGFVFSPDDDLCGVDLDNCRSAELGLIEPWAQAIIFEIGSYCEVSPSGTGVKIFCRAILSGNGRRKDNIELYDSKRYFTVTGQLADPFYAAINDSQAAVENLFHSLHAQKNTNRNRSRSIGAYAGLVPDESIIEQLRVKPKFRQLFDLGDVSQYSSPSEADLALCSFIAGAGGNAETIDRIYRRSALIREKWDRPDYRERTIERASSNSLPKPYKLTDAGNAERMADQHRGEILFCHPWKVWLVWDGKRWQTDHVGGVARRAVSTVRSMYSEAAQLEDSAERDRLAKHATKSEAGPRIDAMIKLARKELPVLPDQLDRDPYLLNCANGTIDLRTGELRENRPDDYITKLCPTRYLPEVSSPVWENFLLEVFDGNLEIIQFVQRLLGYSLTGDVREQILPIFYGSGANGKSTLVTAFTSAVGGDYTMQAPPELIAVRRGESHPTDRADLFGRRLVICQEMQAGGRLNESFVKQLTGGDAIRARRMREDFWEFNPTHKIVLCTNHRPQVSGTDHAIWRRLRLVPFGVRFEGQRQDKSLLAKLKLESEGVLAWAVQGCLKWQRHGLPEPDGIMQATSDYRQQEDLIGQFLADGCVEQAIAVVRANDLYEAYTAWCVRSKERPLSKRRFGAAMTDRGFERIHSNGTVYRGLRLHSGGDGTFGS